MNENLLLEQYSRYKRLALEESPYKCLLNTDIELNPHQINAFCAAIQAIPTGGIILADEVGLGKTIEAGLVLKYLLGTGAKNILIALPATLRKQWEIEMEEKFALKVHILDRLTVEKDYQRMKEWFKSDEVRIVITSYDYSSKLMKRFPFVKWDFIVVDEAHNLRNVFHGTKRARNLYEISKGIPKILLTATPLQNSLSDLHGLVSFIDPRIFGPEKSFNKHFVEGQDYSELKELLHPVLYRTLRKDIKYMIFKKRICKTIDFQLTPEETKLYELVNTFLKREELYSIPSSNRRLIILVIRKLLASSSYALVETFEVLKKRLKKLYQGTKSQNAVEGFDLFWDFVQDEIDESGFDDKAEEDLVAKKQAIQDEIDAVQAIIDAANRVKTNAKIIALKKAIRTALEQQEINNIPQKVVVFTESKRTQKYIELELCKDGFKQDDIVLFNGDYNDPKTKEIYRTWSVKNFGKPNHGKNVEYKHAIVDFFKTHAKILVVTDAGSEGLNLQFCNTVINYDLPWNPQKIEQRIGRCHRYGQEHDVVAMNLLNTDNEADKRVYDILSRKFELFDGVFGASDVALGALESGFSFESMILNIYQKCNTDDDFDNAFNKLNKQLDAPADDRVSQLKSLLLTESPEAKGKALDRTHDAIIQYLNEVDYWKKVQESDIDGGTQFWRIDNWGEECFGEHGLLFLGAFCNGANMLFPILLLCDENGEYIDFTESDIVRTLEKANDENIHVFKPSDDEMTRITHIYDNLIVEMETKYRQSKQPIIDYNKRKVDNWQKLQEEQLAFQLMDMKSELTNLFFRETWATDKLEKEDIRKEIASKKKAVEKFENQMPKKIEEFHINGQEEIASFNKQFDIQPVLWVNVVLKF